MTVTIYGIKTCDTMRKAMAWLRDRGVDHRFHDYRAEGLDRATLQRWTRPSAGETPQPVQCDVPRSARGFAIVDRAQAIALMLENPTLVKRPVLEVEDRVEVGFRPGDYERLFADA